MIIFLLFCRQNHRRLEGQRRRVQQRREERRREEGREVQWQLRDCVNLFLVLEYVLNMSVEAKMVNMSIEYERSGEYVNVV